MTRKFSPVIFLLIVLLFATQVSAQNYPFDHVNISSPNAYALGRYADVPVNYHTGIPKIEVPIYSIQHGPLELPVSISYHSAGLKIEETSSWVGMGWSLNAGGVITRSVRGGPDDCGLSSAVTKWGHFRHHGYNNYLYEVGGPGCTSQNPCPTGAPRHADDMGVMATSKDGEPDLYFFNFNGYTGKFYFHDDRTPIVMPRSDLKIEPILDESMATPFVFMVGFKITTPDGVEYFFGKNQEADGNIDARELTYNMNTHNSSITMQGVVSSWYLNKIISADGLFSIKLVYEADKFSSYSLAKFPVMNSELSLQSFHSYYGNEEYDLAKEFIDGVRLKEIIWANGKLRFTEKTAKRIDLGEYNFTMTDVANTASGALEFIEIDNLSGFCKKFKFSTSYFVDNATPMSGTYTAGGPVGPVNSDRYHLRLDTLQEMTCDNVTKIPPYTFHYYAGAKFNVDVPRKINFGQDHWGFSNGKSNSTLIPTYWVNNDEYLGADRETNEASMKPGTLIKIVYPTGGSTSFAYEANDTYGTVIAKSWPSVKTVTGAHSSSIDVNSQPFTVTAGTHRITFENFFVNPGGSTATVELINNTTNVTIKNIAAQPGETKVEIFTVPSGTYRLRLYKQTTNGVSNGCGAEFCRLAVTSTTANILVGGLRVKSIVTDDGITPNVMVKNFTYSTPAGVSFGNLYSRPVYVAVLRNDIYKQVGAMTGASTSVNGCYNPDFSPLKAYYKSPGSITAMNTTQGNHIGYDEVKVSEPGNGYTVYRYYGSNIWGGINSDIVTRNLDNTTCSISAPNFPAAPVPYEPKRGELKYEGYFNEAGQALKQIDYTPFFSEDTMTTPGYMVALAGHTATSALWATDYEMKSYKKTRLDIVVSESNPVSGTSVQFTTRQFYGSPFHGKPSRNVAIVSNGDSLITLSKYAMDYRVATCDAINSGYASYQSSYNTAYTNFIIGMGCSTSNCKWNVYQQFRWDRKGVRGTYTTHRKNNFTNTVNNLPSNNFASLHLTAKNNAGTEFKPVLQLQDDNNNAMIEVTNWRNNTNLLKGTFMRYDFSTNPTTEVYPNKVLVIDLAAPSTSFTPSASNGTTAITRDTRYTDENLYKYVQGNQVEITTREGITQSFVYGLNNSVPIVKAINVSHATLLAAYNAAAGNITTMRNNATLNGALITSYIYSPILGMTSVQNENRRNEFYEFDVLGRLKQTKDHDGNIRQVLDYKYQATTPNQ